jgi:hypothetical protein
MAASLDWVGMTFDGIVVVAAGIVVVDGDDEGDDEQAAAKTATPAKAATTAERPKVVVKRDIGNPLSRQRCVILPRIEPGRRFFVSRPRNQRDEIPLSSGDQWHL